MRYEYEANQFALLIHNAFLIAKRQVIHQIERAHNLYGRGLLSVTSLYS